MISKYKYNDREEKELLDSVVILCDTREKNNKHITDFFDAKGIKWKNMGLQYGDYSFYVPKNCELNIDRDMYFHKQVCLERKASLEELSGNLTQHRQRFKDELAYQGDMQVIVENSSYKDIVDGNYNTKYNNKSFTASFHSMSTEFDKPFIFIDRDYMGMYIYMHLRYWLRNIIK